MALPGNEVASGVIERLPRVEEPARLFLLVSGAYLLIVGGIGFLFDATFATSAAEARESHGHIFGIFETNGWHNLAAVALGLPSAAVAVGRPKLAVPVVLASGIGNGVAFVAFEVWGADTFWVASNTADQVVHALIAVGGIGAALTTHRMPTHGSRPVKSPT